MQSCEDVCLTVRWDGMQVAALQCWQCRRRGGTPTLGRRPPLPSSAPKQVGQLSIPQLPLTYRLSSEQLGFIQMDYG